MSESEAGSLVLYKVVLGKHRR